jgi:hypothetical protein
MRSGLIPACMLLGTCPHAAAQVSIATSLQDYAELGAAPGHPAYYAPQLDSNFFVYHEPHWRYAPASRYGGAWYERPWAALTPDRAPLFLLRVPARYERQPPRFFSGWDHAPAPRWGEHWSGNWDLRLGAWDRSSRAYAPAPLPTYRYEYSAERYPREDPQVALRTHNHLHQPQEAPLRQQFGRPLASQAPQRRQTQPPPGGPESDATQSPGALPGQSPQPADRVQLPKAAGLLLALALLSGAGVPR